MTRTVATIIESGSYLSGTALNTQIPEFDLIVGLELVRISFPYNAATLDDIVVITDSG